MNRYITLPFVCLAFLLAFASCGERGKSKLPDTSEGVKQSNDAIEANIAALASDDWTTGKYTEILDNQITASTEISDEDRVALTKKLNESYTDQILRCTDSIMDHACAASHDKLKAMNTELSALRSKLENDYRKADIDNALKRYSTHQQMMAYSVSGVYGGKVTADSRYNSSYDNERKAKAASYRKMSPTCTTVLSKINAKNVESILNRRRADFRRKLEKAREKEFNS